MRLAISGLLLLSAASIEAFAPAKSGFRQRTSRSFGVDPSVFHDLPNHVQSLQDAFSTISLSDAVPDVGNLMDSIQSAPDVVPADVSDTVQAAVQAAAPAASEAVEAAADTGSSSGWFGFLTGPTSGLLQLIHSGLVGVGMNSDAWGVSIIALTLVIKLATFPLTKTQLESTNKMQALQPEIKALQAKYQSNPEVMNQKIAEVYQTNQVNPLAGCIPSLVQIPIFIGLYRAVLDLAKENRLDEPFLWLPNLEGPTYGADPTSGSDWLFKNWVDGAPSLGWDDTTAFLILPVFLVVSQFVSMELMQPKNQDNQSNFILKLLPLMIGWFSLNVPAALCLYWVTNNIVTTATSLIIRNSMPEMATATASANTATKPAASEIFAPPPMREKPAGFASAAPPVFDDGVKPITPVVDAEVVDEEDTFDETPSGMGDETPKKKKSRGKKKKKRKN